jgi:hypothetical protein
MDYESLISKYKISWLLLKNPMGCYKLSFKSIPGVFEREMTVVKNNNLNFKIKIADFSSFLFFYLI